MDWLQRSLRVLKKMSPCCYSVSHTDFFFFWLCVRRAGFLISAVAFNDVQLAINMVIVVAVPLMLFSGVFLNPE